MQYPIKIYGDGLSWANTLFLISYGVTVWLGCYWMASQEMLIETPMSLPNAQIEQLSDYMFLGVGYWFLISHTLKAMHMRLYIILLTEEKIYLRHWFWRRAYHRKDIVDVVCDHDKHRLNLALLQERKLKQKQRAWVDISLIDPEREKLVLAKVKKWLFTAGR